MDPTKKDLKKPKKVFDEAAVLKRAAVVVEDLTNSWSIISGNNSAGNIPQFKSSELGVGRVLGRGGYCVVNEIKTVSLIGEDALQEQSAADADTEENDPFTNDVVLQDRSFIAKKYIRNGDARYCIKQISDETYEDKSRYIKGVIDLVIELKILGVLKHPHIIKMRGLAEGNPYRRENFILLDRLYDTLTIRLKKWKAQTTKPWNMLKKKAKKLHSNRMLAAYDLSSAFVYLHERDVIYRDLKPDNIGFDVRGDIKLFDFGLAKELPIKSNSTSDTLYNLSGQTGSLRYMAPEVALGKPYNQKADVFSFSILLWQMLTLKTPFEGYNVNMHKKMVIETGARPKIDSKSSSSVAYILKNSWSAEIGKRLSFDEIHNCLRDELYDDDDLEDGMMDVSNRTARSL